MKYLILAILLMSTACACGKKDGQVYSGPVVDTSTNTPVTFAKGYIMYDRRVICSDKRLFGRLYLNFCDTSRDRNNLHAFINTIQGYDLTITHTNEYIDIEIKWQGLPIHPNHLEGVLHFMYE